METIVTPFKPQITVRPNLILGICCLSLLMVAMDVTIVNVGLPSIRREFGASIAGLQWIIDAYTMVVASLLMLAGATADRFGRRRVFQTGMGLFMIGSLLCSAATSIEFLIIARVVQALGATMLNPVAVSIISNVFTEPKARAWALGIWSAVSGVSMALGPIIGGALIQTVGWRSMFWINVPIAIAAMILAAIHIPESKAAKPRKVDVIGQVLVFTALATLVYGVIEAPRAGWTSPMIITLLISSAVAVVCLVKYESKQGEPLIDLRFFKSFPFSSATIIAATGFASFSGFLFLNTLYLQEIRHFSALTTGLCTLPLALATIISAPLSGKLLAAYGSRPPLMISGIATMCSAAILLNLTSETPIPLMLFTYALFGVGFGLFNAPITNAAVSGMPKSRAGVAAAIASTSRQVGAALGVAIAGTIAGARSSIGPDFTAATHTVWTLELAGGLLICTLGWLASTTWAKSTTISAASLLAEDER